MTLLKSEISKVKKRNICCRNISVRVHLPCQILGRYVQWRRNDYQVVGGGAGAPPPENYLPPNSSFSSDFDHFILKMPFSNENKISKYF